MRHAKSMGLCCMIIALSLPLSAAATQDELHMPLDPVDRAFDDGPAAGVEGMYDAHGAADLAIYPSYHGPDSYHFWHGRVAAHLGIARSDDVAFRMGLTMQTVADTRNSIAFRLTRIYYEAHASVEWRTRSGVVWAGYRHRCSHGADGAVPGRILIRSGPEVGWAGQRELGDLTIRGRTSALATLVGQYGETYKPRVHTTFSGVVAWQPRRISVFAGGGLAAGVVGENGPFAYTLWHSWGPLRADLLPAAMIGIGTQGQGGTARLIVHGQRLLDTGHGDDPDPVWLLSVGPHLSW